MTSFFMHLSPLIHLTALHLHAFNGNSAIFPGILGFVRKYTAVSILHFYILFAADAMDIAHNTTTTLTYHGTISFPAWSMNGSPVTPPWYRTKYVASTGDWLAILTIDGNETCGIMDLSCRVEGQTVYTERLDIEGL